MQSLYSHEKRQTVPGTLHGVINQVNKSLFHAVVYAFEQKSDFYLTTEDTAFGDFDDLIIVTEDGRVKAIQYKHQRDANGKGIRPNNGYNCITGPKVS